MQLIDEHDSVRIIDKLFHDGLQAFFKLPAVFGSGNDQGEIQYEDAFIRKKGRNLAVDDALSQTLNNRRFSDAGIANEHGIVLGATAQNLNHTIDFVVAP